MLNSLRHADAARGGVLAKMPKRGQDLRVDMPTIGPATMKNAHAAGLAGVVVAAGGVMIMDAQNTIDGANRCGLFLAALQIGE